MAKKSCKKGYYYCYTSKKCKRIPMGYYVGGGGWLRKEEEKDESEGKKKNGNGNGSNGDGNGNGGSDGGSNGGGVSEAWSAKYKKSIDCDNPKGFSQRAHCRGRKMNEAKGGDHEVAMAQSQLKKSARNISKLRKALGKKEKDIPAWMQAKITDTAHDTDAAAGYVDKIGEQYMTQQQRAEHMARKMVNQAKGVAARHDAAKKEAQNVKTTSGSVTVRSEEVIAEKRDGKSSKDKGYSLRDWFKGGGWKQTGGKYDGKPCAKQPGQKTKPYCRDADDRAAMSKEERNKRAAKKRKEDPNPNRTGKARNVTQESFSNWRTDLEQLIERDAWGTGPMDRIKCADGVCRTPQEIEKLRQQNLKKKGITLDKAHFEPEGELVDEGKKDACYHKVKSRYSVWPSAYASGALVKCRKVGAKNWGNKTKKEGYEFSNWRDDFQATEYESVDIIKAEPLKPTDGIGSRMLGEAKKCWKGYKKTGTQKLFGKTYNRCEKIKEGAAITGLGTGLAIGALLRVLNKKGGPTIDQKNAQDARKHLDNFRKKQKIKEDWQKSNRKDGVDGMSQKSVDAYRRENPGSKLKTAVTGKVKKGSKDSKRRKSFCARSDGQRKMHNIDCKKTPDKKICKARRRWKC